MVPGIYFDILSGILFGIYFDILSGILFGILSGILLGIYSCILSGILSGGWGPAVPTGLGWGWAVPTGLGRSAVEVQQCLLDLRGPRLRSSSTHWYRAMFVDVQRRPCTPHGQPAGPWLSINTCKATGFAFLTSSVLLPVRSGLVAVEIQQCPLRSQELARRGGAEEKRREEKRKGEKRREERRREEKRGEERRGEGAESYVKT